MGRRRSYQEVPSDPDTESIDGRLPNFLVVGAQRGGTTWLYECLRAHPEVYVPDTKEVNFFSDIGAENFPKGVAWYKGFFEEATSQHRALGEITPEYLVDEKAPSRIRRLLGDIKIIVIVRNPIERAYSSYGRGLRENNWNYSFETFLEENVDYCIDRGMYWEQLQRYLECFSEDNVQVMVYEDLLDDPLSYISTVFAFLDVDSSFVPPVVDKRFNIGVSQVSWFVRLVVFLRDLVYRIPLVSRSVKLVQRSSVGNRIVQSLLGKNRENRVDLRARYDLSALFAEDVRKLSQFLERDLNAEWGILR